MIKRYFKLVLTSICLISACKSTKVKKGTLPSIAYAYKQDFLIGTALDLGQIQEVSAAESNIVRTQFNAVTPENVMKCEHIHPAWAQYDFAPADQYVTLGEKNHQYIVGHTLVWHSQLSPFVKNIQDKDSFRTFMDNHIQTIVGRYKGRVNSWDVVNEALNEDGTLRESPFYKKLGAGYIEEAFRLAAATDPSAALYYNDYNIELPKKREGAIRIIKALKEKGVRIDGIGIQGHWHLNKVPFKEIEESIIAFSQLGVKVAITELDISVLPNPFNLQGAEVSQNFKNSKEMNPYPNGLPDSIGNQLADNYKKLFTLFLKYKKDISRVTFWGVNDRQTWLNDWPINGRTNYPLLFDRDNQPKKAFYEILHLTK
ncbi:MULTISPECIES: endo-1,4-beta-xylanase [Chitinophagaceae]